MEDRNKGFISETITGRELTRQRAIKYLALSVICGIVFGAAAVGVILLARQSGILPRSEQTEASEPEGSAEYETDVIPESEAPDSIPSAENDSSEADEGAENGDESVASDDAEAGSDEDASEGTSGTGEPDTDQDQETAPADGEEDTELSDGENTGADENPAEDAAIHMTMDMVPEYAARFITSVETVVTEDTWFDIPVESVTEHAGIVVKVSESEITVLTVEEAVADDRTYRVVFSDGTRQSAVVKDVSVRDGIALFAVPVDGLGSDLVERLEAVPVPEEDSALLSAGEQIFAIGAPLGRVYSHSLGYVGYQGAPEPVYDGSVNVIYSDITADYSAGTFIIDERGIFTGMALPSGDENPMKGTRIILADGILKTAMAVIEGSRLPYAGIMGADVGFDMTYAGVPAGVYVTDIDMDGPAYAAGIRRGDIITAVGGTAVVNVSEYSKAFGETVTGETVQFTVKRLASGNEYREIAADVTAAGR